MRAELAWQPSLLDGGLDGGIDGGEVGFDPELPGLRRRELGHGAWLDIVSGWCTGADLLFARLLTATPWTGPREVPMYDRLVLEPRRTHRWHRGEQPAAPDPLPAMAAALGRRYCVAFTQIGANLYRDGADSVAWHGDRVARDLPEAVVALVSLGAVRPFRLRPTGGGPSVAIMPGPGDLLVMGGTCQRTWQHSVPKTRAAAPRISVQFRHVYR